MATEGLLPHLDLTDWLHDLAGCADQPRSRPQAIARTNTKNLLRSLWFRRPGGGPLAEPVLAAQARVNRYAA